jgi:hypothetical protein
MAERRVPVPKTEARKPLKVRTSRPKRIPAKKPKFRNPKAKGWEGI